MLYTQEVIELYLQQLQRPQPHSHKAQNGKTLVIGGSDLFHAASQWSFRVISRLVDMTFYSSVAENNALLHDAKLYGTDGVIVPRTDLPHYLEEVDSILIGPGLRRDFDSHFLPEEIDFLKLQDLSPEEWEKDTAAMVSVLLRHFARKKWVLDAGALQVLRQKWVPPKTILTPHRGECERLLHNWFGPQSQTEKVWHRVEAGLDEVGQAYFQGEESLDPLVLDQKILETFLSPKDLWELQRCARETQQATIIVKGQADLIWNAERAVAVVGGNAGLTKGGTGDVLAGLCAGLAAKSDPFVATVVASYLNKKAGHELFLKQNTMFNTSDLVEQLPYTFQQIV